MKLITDAMAQTEQPAAPAAPTPPTPTPPAPAPQAAPQTQTQTSTGASGQYDPNQQPPSLPDLFAQLIPIFVVMGIVYILVIRPRARKEKAALEALRNVRRGDIIVTTGGFVGKVARSVDDNEIELEIAQNVRIRLVRTAIAEVRSKGEPVKDTPAPAPAAEKAPAKPAAKSAQTKAKS
ncbi:preprotein translocase subunit YajC [Methylocystis sp. JAN1]|uniref:preprotein translocase subunit YajC n=1 Tax=Methylocystis sp. JAN1 TaxID=3397211 RepID=UPI003FA31141